MNGHMTKEYFVNLEKLYHYTSFYAAVKIIESKELRFGKLNKMNDIRESYRVIFYHNEISEECIKCELEKYRQFSLTQDCAPRRGFDIPAMWGHYADKGEGICLVFDRAKLMNCLPDGMMFDSVCYKDDYDGDILISQEDKSDLQTLFRDRQKELFFTKSYDWSYEQEFRLLTRSDVEQYELSYGDSLIGIIFHFAESEKERSKSVFNSVEKRIMDKIKDAGIEVFVYGRWDKDPTLTHDDELAEDWSCINKYQGLELDTTSPRRV